MMKKLITAVLLSGSLCAGLATAQQQTQVEGSSKTPQERADAIKKAIDARKANGKSNPSIKSESSKEADKARMDAIKLAKDLNEKKFIGNAAQRAELKAKIDAYAHTTIKADMSHLNDKEKKLVKKLIQAGRKADEIFWKQISAEAVSVRDSLKKARFKPDTNIDQQMVKLQSDYVMLNYGPFDVLEGGKRFAGKGPETLPAVANYYPQDMTKEEFEAYVKAHPGQKDDLESQYTVVKRKGSDLYAVPFHAEYPKEVKDLSRLLTEAAELADDPQLKAYLTARAKAVLTDDYLESDMMWMDVNGKIDIVIGPIENYRDEMFNYKTAYECVVMVKDSAATKQFETFKSLIDYFEAGLPTADKFRRNKGSDIGSQINIMNVAYFGGDCQCGVKTIAASLPNDPRVREAKGGKNNMYKNMMEAKFDKIVVPIGQKILEPEWVKYVDKYSFTTFVSLHEVSHTLGRDYVYGKDSLSVRKALKERYSGIEECKADILSMYNHKHLVDKGMLDKEGVKKAMATYLAGLYRSIRFGAEEAHGVANVIQLNWLKETGAIVKNTDGKLSINESVFFDKVAGLARKVLEIEATGDYEEAGRFLEKYGKVDAETKGILDQLKSVPRDLNTNYPG